MNPKTSEAAKGHDFSKRGKVSVWASQYPYAEVPDEYFEERFSHKGKRASNQWSRNFNLNYFMPDNMETNGSHEGLVSIERAAGECSYSNSYMTNLLSKARKLKLQEVSWVILLFEHEYSARLSGVNKDEVMTFLGAFDYDDEADNLFQPD
ncbi:immunity 22 family protein [Aestuariirhabdus sp. Z083]|nr:immunity 22 family protein [Aestuariirhabdus haliotis]